MKKSVKMENLYISYLLDNGIAVPTGKQYGYIDEKEWATWFPHVAQTNSGKPKEPNKDNLSVWTDGRGAFVDCQSVSCGTFFDVKMKDKKPKFRDMKQEVWAGSPALQKRSSHNEMTPKQVVDMLIKNQDEKQIVRSLKGMDQMPYLLQFVWQEINVDGTWSWKCICVNGTKYLKEQAKFNNGNGCKSGVSGIIFRDKKGSKNSDYSESSPSARVELKFYHTHEQMIEMGVATPVCDPDKIDWLPLV
jgi:hypothetical protein